MINFDDIKETNYVSEAGTYTFVVKDVTFATSTNGKPYHKFKCETVDGEVMFLSLYITPESAWKYKKFVVALGHPGVGNIDEESTSKMCVGKTFKGTVVKPVKENVVTGEKEESKYFEIVKFEKAE